MDYRNADGSIAEMCGNGVRVFARYLLDHGLASGPAFAVATRGGSAGQVEPDGRITVDMGPVTVLGPAGRVLGGAVCDGLRISVGNPHLACLVDGPLDKFDLSVPPGLDPGDFPAGGNVELVQVTGRCRDQHAGARARHRARPGPAGPARSRRRPPAAARLTAAPTGPGTGSWQVHRARRRAHRDPGGQHQLADRPGRDRRRRRAGPRLARRTPAATRV